MLKCAPSSQRVKRHHHAPSISLSNFETSKLNEEHKIQALMSAMETPSLLGSSHVTGCGQDGKFSHTVLGNPRAKW